MYEEQRGLLDRWLQRAARFVSWRAKAVLRQPRRVLVEIRWRLGDEIMAIPIYQALRDAYPDCVLSVRCNFPELLEGNPHVASINDEGFRPDRYVCLRSGPRLLVRIEHYAHLAGVPVPNDGPRLHYQDWRVPQLDGVSAPFIAFAPGASWATKRWPVQRWQALGEAVKKVGYDIVEVGQAGEAVGAGLDLTGKTTVREAACVLRAARLVVSCDSGPMHLARAAGTPVVALFGPTAPGILFRNDAALYPVTGDVPCTGCWNRPEHGGAKADPQPGTCPLGDASCVMSIRVDSVLSRIYEALEREIVNR